MVITKDSESFDPGSSPGRTFLFCNFWSNAESRFRVGGCSGCALPVLVAQLDKASDYESEDWGFKSLQGYLLLFSQPTRMRGGAALQRGRSVFAAIAQLGERQTEDLKVPGSIPGGGIPGILAEW